MNKVWIVYDGNGYDDWFIVAIFATQKRAEAFMASLGKKRRERLDVEEYPLNEEIK